MTITFKTKHLVIVLLIITISFLGLFFRDKFKGIFLMGADRTVENALNYLKDPNSSNGIDELTIFDVKYYYGVLSNYSYYKVDEWELNSNSIGNDKYKVKVKGSTVNGFGVKLDRSFEFIVEKKIGKWLIVDSYGFASIDKTKDVYGKSDMEQYNMIEDMKKKVTVESWDFESSYDDSVKGSGTIINNSNLNVSYVKFVIEYKDNSGKIVNTDEAYAVGSDDLLPGQRRKFEWYTSNCYDCNKASSHLKFD